MWKELPGKVTKDLLFIGGFGFTLLVPTITAFVAGWKEAATLGVLGILALITTRIEDIELVKLWGMEAKLREAIDEATAKLDQLRALAAAVATPAVDELAMHGSLLTQLSFEYRYSVKKKVEKVLTDVV